MAKLWPGGRNTKRKEKKEKNIYIKGRGQCTNQSQSKKNGAYFRLKNS